jgi:hypothetical protein
MKRNNKRKKVARGKSLKLGKQRKTEQNRRERKVQKTIRRKEKAL